MSLSLIILVGVPLTAAISFFIASLQRRNYNKKILELAFSILCRNSGRRISGITGNLKLVNQLNEEELKNKDVWQQRKL